MGRASARKAARVSLEAQPWVAELAREMRAWAALQQFGTMLQAVRQAAADHGVDLVELQSTVARVAIRERIVRPLRRFESEEEMRAWEASRTSTPPPAPGRADLN